MAHLFRDTIFALSSGKLPSGIAIVRISGPAVRFVLETFVSQLPEPRYARFGAICDPTGRVLDHGFTLYFPAPHSFTGEDCAEFHLHGGPAVVAAMLRTLGELDGLRQAEPGEFSQRAFLNGKFDLTEVEALSDLIAAETESQRRFALENAQGAQKHLYDAWRGQLLHARAMIEAPLDFSDEADIPAAVSPEIWRSLADLQTELVNHAGGFSRAEIIRDGFRVVIVGAPNAGKSSLLNALSRRDAAIVSEEPGTTRDLVEVSLDLDGNLIILTDTAGIRAATGSIEALGIERALARARQAHLILLLEDSFAPVDIDFHSGAVRVLRIGTKLDLGSVEGDYDHVLSAKDGAGIDELMRRIAEFARAGGEGSFETLPSRLRHVQHLRICTAELGQALNGTGLGLELRAEHLRQAANSLARIVGSVDVEDLLGAIFSEFCVGK